MSVQDVIPFSAVSGNMTAKKAVMCLLANPNLKCMLINGPAGTGKTTISRAISSLDESIPVVSAPVGVSDDRLFGSIDIEKAITTGEMEVQTGLFSEANNGILSIDDIELMDIRLALQCVECAVKGQVALEREGLSAKFPTNASIIATTAQSPKKMNGHLKDRFDICVRMERPSMEEYVASLRNNLEFAEDQKDMSEFIEKDREIYQRILRARADLDKVRVLVKHKDAISRICRKYGVKGQRGPLSCAATAATLAALDGRKKTSQDDIVLAVELCLNHRRTKFEPKKKPGEEELPRGFAYAGSKRFIHDDRRKNIEASLVDKINDKVIEDTVENADENSSVLDVEEIETKVGDRFDTIDIMESADAYGNAANSKAKKYVESPMGRYSAFRIPMGPCTDLAIDATIRAAAPYQKVRGRGDGIMKIDKNDVREKVRTKHTEHTFLFLIDTSGSLIIRNRIAKMKAAIISMLEIHFVKRDRVGLMGFNDDRIEVFMQPTRAIDELSGAIDGIVVGCGTPLSGALVKCWDFVNYWQKRHPEEIVHVVLFSDGKATTPLEEGADPAQEALNIALNLRKQNVDWTVIDTGLGSSKDEMPKYLARNLEGRFFLLDQLESKDTVSTMWGGEEKPPEVTMAQPSLPTAYDLLQKRGLR